ncbi:MAG: heavy-metal-associated domain-containing protein, partial [bacterium]|nr:heavy-metal-associated domain-containing protein [bacterium]
MKFNVLCLVLVLLVSVPVQAGFFGPKKAASNIDRAHWRHHIKEANMKTPDIIVNVKGMTCMACEFGIRKKILAHPAIAKVNAHHKHQHVAIKLNKAKTITDDKIR